MSRPVQDRTLLHLTQVLASLGFYFQKAPVASTHTVYIQFLFANCIPCGLENFLILMPMK